MIFSYKHKQCIIFSVFSFLVGCMLTSFFMKIEDNSSVKSPSIFGYVRNDVATLNKHSQHYFMIVLVLTSPDNIARRNVVRETWFRLCINNGDILCLFVVGKSGNKSEDELVLQEQAKYSDLLILPDIIDTYESLSKKMLASFKWIDKNVLNYRFILKCDDDSFVRLEKLFHVLKTEFDVERGHNLYWGFFDGRAHVKRSGKWQELQWNLCDRYLPYALGGGYVLSKHLITYIARNSEDLVLYNSEDVSVGVWLASIIVNRQHDCRFDTEAKSRGCSDRYLVTHKQSEDSMRRTYASVHRTGRLCEREYQESPGYNYNWTVLPSQCCYRNKIDPNIF